MKASVKILLCLELCFLGAAICFLALFSVELLIALLCLWAARNLHQMAQIAAELEDKATDPEPPAPPSGDR